MQQIAFLLMATISTPAFASDNACEPLTGLQVAAGFVTWLRVLSFLAIIVGVASISVLARHAIKALLIAFALIPVAFYEALGYLSSAALLVAGNYYTHDDQLWFVFGGALLLGAMISITLSRLSTSKNFSAFFGILCAVWAAIALYFNSDAVGFLAVLAFMGALGFSAAAIPLGYIVGFEEGMMPRATAMAFLVTVASSTAFVKGLPANNPFVTGGRWMGPIVVSIGLLIMASRYWKAHVPYVLRQIPAFVFGFGSTFYGSTLGIPHLAGIGGTFFVLYLIEKMSDIPAKSMVGYASVGLLTAAALGSGVWWAQHHMDLVQPYLLF